MKDRKMVPLYIDNVLVGECETGIHTKFVVFNTNMMTEEMRRQVKPPTPDDWSFGKVNKRVFYLCPSCNSKTWVRMVLTPNPEKVPCSMPSCGVMCDIEEGYIGEELPDDMGSFYEAMTILGFENDIDFWRRFHNEPEFHYLVYGAWQLWKNRSAPPEPWILDNLVKPPKKFTIEKIL